jgi:hypothetical protein
MHQEFEGWVKQKVWLEYLLKAGRFQNLRQIFSNYRRGESSI